MMHGDKRFGFQPGPLPETVSREEKIAALRLEIKYREKMYPKWVEQNRLDPAEAEKQLAYMRAILEDYERQPWPQLREFRDEWLNEDTQRITFMSVSIRKLTRHELMAVIGYCWHRFVAADSKD